MIRNTTTLALAMLLVLATAAGAAGNSKKKEEAKGDAVSVYNEGVDLMKEGDCKAAAGKFQKAIQMKDDFAEAHNNLGYCLRKLGEARYGQALEHYNRALELKPDLAQAHHYRGVLYVLMGEEDKARQDHEALAELDRDLAEELLQVIATGEEPEGQSGVAPRWR